MQPKKFNWSLMNNYKYCDQTWKWTVLQIKGGKKFKKNSQFNGFPGVFHMSKGNENGKFNFGLRFGKCIDIDDTIEALSSERIAKISGHFVNDKLQGRVVIETRSGLQTVGFAHDGVLLGILRNFQHGGSGTEKSLRLSNVTDVDGRYQKSSNYYSN